MRLDIPVEWDDDEVVYQVSVDYTPAGEARYDRMYGWEPGDDATFEVTGVEVDGHELTPAEMSALADRVGNLDAWARDYAVTHGRI